MKKLIVLVVVLIAGCESEFDLARYNQLLRHSDKFTLAYQQRRENLVASFKEAYPDNWEEKLLEYDLQQDVLQKQQQALSQQQKILNEQYQRRVWADFFKNWPQMQQQQRMYDAQYNYYTRPYKVGDGPTIYP